MPKCRTVILLAALLSATACSLNLKAALRNASGRDVVVEMPGQSFAVKAGDTSKAFSVGFPDEKSAVHPFAWKVSVRSGDCVYHYDTPSTFGGGGTFPQEPVIFVLAEDMVINAQTPAEWARSGRTIANTLLTPTEACGVSSRP